MADPYALKTTIGRALPLGATGLADGINFALLCKHGTAVSLVLSEIDSNEPFERLTLDPRRHRTGDHWHIHVSGLPNAFRYGWSVNGPKGANHRFDPSVVLLDPAGPVVVGGGAWGTQCEASPKTSVRRSAYFRRPRYDWQDDLPPLTPPEDSIIYELHVRGYTCHPSSKARHPGTFAGLTEKIGYLKELGITAVEMLPIHEFDECDCTFVNPDTGEKLYNFWGYNSLAFAAPKGGYAASAADHGQVTEFRDLVKALHRYKLEAILDVVFNHTGEGDDRGRTTSFRGLDNELYYMLGPDGRYRNYTGCGNTLNCNHPVVRDLLLDCLRYWVATMHIDGFRFDLASVFGRGRDGTVLMQPPVVESIVEDGVLARTKLIAEPWDAVGLYQVGNFPFGRRWSEWNGRYRDDVRRFWRGDGGMAAAFATRLCGSSDLYRASGRSPWHSVNFVTCHDGFTLADLVSYNRKHNRANGESNRDGTEENYSWNGGAEGPTTSRRVLINRLRRAKSLWATLLLSQGVPMILAGDEFLRTQSGNNNAYCQDNEVSWIDWGLKRRNAGFFRFARALVQFRKRHPAFRRRDFFSGSGSHPDIVWHGRYPYQPDWSPNSRQVACALNGERTGREQDDDFYLAFNGAPEPTTFRVPPSPNGRPWHRAIDTGRSSPDDYLDRANRPPVAVGDEVALAGFGLLVLVADRRS